MFFLFIRNPRRTNEYEYSKKLSSESYDLPAIHWVGKVSFGKLISEKFKTFAAPKVQKVNPFL